MVTAAAAGTGTTTGMAGMVSMAVRSASAAGVSAVRLVASRSLI